MARFHQKAALAYCEVFGALPPKQELAGLEGSLGTLQNQQSSTFLRFHAEHSQLLEETPGTLKVGEVKESGVVYAIYAIHDAKAVILDF